MKLCRCLGFVVCATIPACGVTPGGGLPIGEGSGGSEDSSSTTGGSGPSSDGEVSTATTAETSATGGPKLDVGAVTTGSDVGSCKVSDDDDLDAPGACSTKAPPDSFEAVVQWEWAGPEGEPQSIVTPLVANFTDDNGDGEIDLCDTPDVVIVTYPPSIYQGGHISVLDGETGEPHFQIPDLVQERITPALGDIDGDGLVEIVTFTWLAGGGDIVAFEHDGEKKWQRSAPWLGNSGPAIALADLDADGDVEIIAGGNVMDHEGNLLWQVDDPVPYYAATTAADLDDDGDLEVILGQVAYHHDGTLYYPATLSLGFPQVANLDDDPEPEILLVGGSGVSVLEHDGQVKFSGRSPSGDPISYWDRPATVHDFDGDGQAEAAASSATHYTMFEADATLGWVADVQDGGGLAAGTAFDFLGDAGAEAMYADESTLFVFGSSGETLMSLPRISNTVIEYPTVADIDNDGSAEIVVVSNNEGVVAPDVPAVRVFRDAEDRWIQARRIWNQHTYHVTNVREDGTIPSPEPHHWNHLNTFRTNGQIDGGQLCIPPAG